MPPCQCPVLQRRWVSCEPAMHSWCPRPMARSPRRRGARSRKSRSSPRTIPGRAGPRAIPGRAVCVLRTDAHSSSVAWSCSAVCAKRTSSCRERFRVSQKRCWVKVVVSRRKQARRAAAAKASLRFKSSGMRRSLAAAVITVVVHSMAATRSAADCSASMSSAVSRKDKNY